MKEIHFSLFFYNIARLDPRGVVALELLVWCLGILLDDEMP